MNAREKLIEMENGRRGSTDGAKEAPGYEYCTRCDANLTFQKGFDPEAPYWICAGCGEMLINPALETETGIVWLCDGCGSMLNIQSGFDENREAWKCSECGFVNLIDGTQVYLSEDEYNSSLKDPYKGLSDEAVMALFSYDEIRPLNEKGNVCLLQDRESGEIVVRKILRDYDLSVYSFLKDAPVAGMPGILNYFEGDNGLIVLEEYIEGKTVEEVLMTGGCDEPEAVYIATAVCRILSTLHGLPVPIIHRDVKPSNILISSKGEVFLLDMNVSKWYDPDRNDDTRYLGTQYYAAPEQAGFGLAASSPKTDIYNLGVTLNVMLTGKLPKEELPSGKPGEIIRRCISMDAERRYTAEELLEELESIGG